jgi:endonuclease-8
VKSFRARRIPDAAADEILGRQVVAVDARGKNLLVRFDGDRVLHVHLRMQGRVFVVDPRRAGAASRAELHLGVAGATVIGRHLPVCRLLGARQVDRALADLGPDLVDEGFDEDKALARLRGLGAREIGDALLVQSAAAGIGNVYKSEVLFLEQLDPRAHVSSLDDTSLRAVLRRASILLRRNLGAGPRTTRPTLGGLRLWVYGRAGRPCLRCGATVRSFRQGAPPGRSTYACPACQASQKGGP